jgi:uncharacterized zinc-type alcohol dehydrogenase-like protein
MCVAGQENFCRAFPTLTYGDTDRQDGSITSGGYAREYVVRDAFAYVLPDGLDAAAAAPLMCAGVTVWEPLRALGVGPGSRVAVAGLGGLGHLAVKPSVARGAATTVVSRGQEKRDDDLRLGADDQIDSTDDRQMALHGTPSTWSSTPSRPRTTRPRTSSWWAWTEPSASSGTSAPSPSRSQTLLVGREKLSSAGSGGRRSTAVMLRFCADHGLVANIEVLLSSQVNTALDRLRRNDVRYRFVLDMSDLEQGNSAGNLLGWPPDGTSVRWKG